MTLMPAPVRFLPSLMVLCLALPAAGQTTPPTTTAADPAATAPQTPTPTDPAAAQPAQTPPATAPAKPPGKPNSPGGRAPLGKRGPALPAPPQVADHVNFQLKFPPDQGGGSAAGNAESLEYKRDDYAVLTGAVLIRYQDMELHADKAEVDLKTRLVKAEGNVILDQGPRRLTGTTLDFNLKTKTGKVIDATAHVSNDYFFTGKEIEKTGDNTYTVLDGIFTSCSQKVPDWSFKLSRAEVEVEGYARAHNVRMRIKELPVLYTPYILFPTKSDRASGLLIPNLGYSERRGALIGLAYFQTLGRSYDTTVHLDDYSKGYIGIGNEFRYHPTQGTQGDLQAYTVRDSIEPRDWRWKIDFNHVTEDLPWGMRGVVHYEDYSDFNFFQDFERDFNVSTLRFINSRAFVSGSWGSQLFNFLLNDQKTFINVNSIVEQRKLPELQYSLRSTQLAKTPLYVSFDSQVDNLDINRPDNYSGRYTRLNLFPQLTLPLSSIPWLSLSVSGGERFTYYSNSLTPPDPAGVVPQALTDKGLTRALPVASADLLGPSISRIWNADLFGFGKFKHIIQPRVSYNYQGDYDRQGEVPIFDEVDAPNAVLTNLAGATGGRAGFSGRSDNSVTVSLDNRLLGKPKGEDTSSREMLLFRVSREYSLDKLQPLEESFDGLRQAQAGPLDALVRFNPSDAVNIQAEATYSLLFKGIGSTSLSGNVGDKRGDSIGVTWFTSYTPENGMNRGNQARLGWAWNVKPNKVRLEGQVNYDFQEHNLLQQSYAMTWSSQCYSYRLELRQYPTFNLDGSSGPFDREIRFSLTLKNIGTFLDLNSRSSYQNSPRF